MGWIYLGLSLISLAHALNATHPSRRGFVMLAVSFMAGWLTIELAWHHLVLIVLLTIGFGAAGAFDTVPGQVGLAVMAAAWLLLLRIALVTRKTVVIVRGALEELDPGPDAPRFPRSHVVFPFLMGHRKGVRRRRNVAFARVGGKTLRLDVTLPSAPVPGGGQLRPALLQVHGGGWVIGDKREQGIPLLNHMAAQGWVGFNANYRLSPGVTPREQLADVKRALVWVREHAAEYGIDPEFICVTGGSAGGHLCAMAALTVGDASFQPGFEDADTSVAAAVPFYGVYDLTPEGEFGADPRVYSLFLERLVMQAFVADEPEKYVELSPVHRVHPGVPPFFVIHGDLDSLAPVADARAFVAALRVVSHEPVVYAEMQGAQHAFEIFPSVRSARVMEGVERFLDTIWERRHHADQPTAEVEADLADTLTE